MSSNTRLLKIIFLAVVILSRPAIISGQRPANDTISGTEAGIDTSDYIPSFYYGALDYNLMIAASKGYSSEIERLIGEGADINAETAEGATPLIFAVSNNEFNAVRALLNHSPELNQITRSYETPLIIAVKNRNPEIAELLIRAGADIELSDRHGATPLHNAAYLGYADITDLLLYYGASIDKKSYEGATPLITSVWAGFPDVAELLIKNGANIEARDNEGFTAFLIAAYYGDTIIMEMLYKQGVDIYSTNNKKHSALTLAIMSGQDDAVSYLLRIGDKWIRTGADFINPYTVASRYRRKDILEILEKNHVPGKIHYEIDQMSLSASTRFSFHDIYTGFNFGFKEPYLNLGFFAGCDTKFWYTRLLVKDSEHLYYQFMDKGSVVYTGLFKDFALTSRSDRMNISFSTYLSAGYSFGNMLKGTRIKPANKAEIIPAMYLKMEKMNFGLFAGLEYLKTDYYKNGPIWFRIGCSYNYFFDKVRIKVKPLKWY
jgi:ankyrin repeat protein